jgi:hypothetical protein
MTSKFIAPSRFNGHIDGLASDKAGPKTDRQRGKAQLSFRRRPLAHAGINKDRPWRGKKRLLEWACDNGDEQLAGGPCRHAFERVDLASIDTIQLHRAVKESIGDAMPSLSQSGGGAEACQICPRSRPHHLAGLPLD